MACFLPSHQPKPLLRLASGQASPVSNGQEKRPGRYRRFSRAHGGCCSAVPTAGAVQVQVRASDGCGPELPLLEDVRTRLPDGRTCGLASANSSSGRKSRRLGTAASPYRPARLAGAAEGLVTSRSPAWRKPLPDAHLRAALTAQLLANTGRRQRASGGRSTATRGFRRPLRLPGDRDGVRARAAGSGSVPGASVCRPFPFLRGASEARVCGCVGGPCLVTVAPLPACRPPAALTLQLCSRSPSQLPWGP